MYLKFGKKTSYINITCLYVIFPWKGRKPLFFYEYINNHMKEDAHFSDYPLSFSAQKIPAFI